MVTILPALRQVRKDLVPLLDRRLVERICHELGHDWRHRQLDPYTILHLFILQVLNNNTAITHLPHLSGERFTASAYCQARQRLPLEWLQRLVSQLGKQWDDRHEVPHWHGHRVFLEDGSGFSMPDTAELQAAFGQPGNQRPGCGFPVAHLLALLDAETGFLQDASVFPLRTQDIAHAAELHAKLAANDLLVGDRGFCSYAHLALILQAHLHAVFRIHQRQLVSFRPHRPSSVDVPGFGSSDCACESHLAYFKKKPAIALAHACGCYSEAMR